MLTPCRLSRLGLVLSTVLLSMAGSTAPSFAASNLVFSGPVPANPVVGETVSFTVGASGFVSPEGASFEIRDYANIDGAPLAQHQNDTSAPSPPSSVTLTTSFATTGAKQVLGLVYDPGITYPEPGSQLISATPPPAFTVWPLLTGAINPVAGTPRLGEALPLSATAAGGKTTGTTFAWDVDGDGFDDGAGPTIAPVVSGGIAGPRTIRVQIKDGAVPAHTIIATRQVTFAAALPVTTPVVTTPVVTTPAVTTPGVTLPPATTPAVGLPGPPPAPAGCTKQAAWANYEITTAGCFTKDTKGRWTTTSLVKLNGIELKSAAGKPFFATPGTGSKPGGRVELAGASIELKDATLFRGDIDWDLPAAKQGTDALVATLTVPSGARLFGLTVEGTIGLRLGRDNAGRYYADVPMNIGLPAVFKAGPEAKSPGLTSTVVLSVDKNGVRNNGLKLQVTNAYLGKLKVESVCFAYAPAGQTAIDSCKAPSLDGKPYLTCAENVASDRWSGSASVILPTESKTRLGAFGSVANQQLASLGGFVDNLGKTVPIATGVYLNRIGFGICINPPPLKIRADVGIAILPPASGPPTVAINGYFLYTDALGNQPWSLELGGTILVFNKQVGSGKVIIKGSGSLDFEVNVGLDLGGVVKIEGGVSGWIEPQYKKFLVQGFVKGCIWVVCARADGLVSNIGLSGCVDLGVITWWTLERDADWTWWAWWRLHWETHQTILKGGFGYTWSSGNVSLLGSSCDFGPWKPSRNASGASLVGLQRLALLGEAPSATAAQASDGITVAEGTPAVSVRVRGAGGAPKLQVEGPGGVRFASALDAGSTQLSGKWMIAENPSDGSTSLVLINPEAGRWSITAQAGTPPIASLEESPYEGAPQVVGGIGNAAGGRKTLNIGFSLPAGMKLALEEEGKDVQQTLASDVRPGRCPPEAERSPGGQAVKCAELRFTPAEGPGGERKIFAAVSRDGVPVSREFIATFRTRGWTTPARPARLVLSRKGRTVTVAWTSAAHTSRYSVSVVAGDGQQLGFDLPSRCRAVRVTGVASGARVKAAVTGVRQDLVTGRTRTAVLGKGAKTSAKRAVRAKPICR